jgi:NAD(P)-dependent dehydrogenase (short-subunit alcohol dehydrogenase family)
MQDSVMGELQNKAALITGAGSGIGAAIATTFAREGASVVISDVDMAGARQVLDQVKKSGGNGIVVKCDVSSKTECEELVQQTLKAFGRLDVAVNNAGIGGPAALTGDYPIDGWEKVMNVNLNGVFHGMRYQIPAMLQTGGGSIINITSILGSVGFATACAYVTAKHGVNGLTKVAAIEYAQQGIRVNAVGPGFIKTPLLDQIPEEQLAAIASLHPMGRLGTSQEVAELVLWLATEKSSFVTGSYYPVDGGYLSR